MDLGSKSKYTLFIPSWYPDRLNGNNGIFIKKHAHLVSRFQPVKVLYASADKSLKNALFEMVEKNEEGIEYTMPNGSKNEQKSAEFLWRKFLCLCDEDYLFLSSSVYVYQTRF